jgi:hypothetical protein
MLPVMISVALVCMGLTAVLAAAGLQCLHSARKDAADRNIPRPEGLRHLRRLSVPKKLAFSGLIFVLVGLIAYGGLVIYRSRKFYLAVKEATRWNPPAFAFDPELGHVPVPNYRGTMRSRTGPPLPIAHDENGHRIPVDQPTPPGTERPLVLALGCSFTYGYCCLAEEAFPYLVGRRLKGKSVNAGVSGYGLAQIALVAKRLIPKYKADYVLIQYSPWLLDRAIEPTPKHMTARLTAPFYYERPGGVLAVQPPVFRPFVRGLSTLSYADTEESLSESLRFQYRVALPLYLHDDWDMILYNSKTCLGLLPKPAPWGGLAPRVYREIADLCEAANSRMVIVALGNRITPTPIPESFSRLPALVVRPDLALRSRLDQKTEESYSKAYMHWRGSPPVLVDRHPNSLAHSIMADEIVAAIKAELPTKLGYSSFAQEGKQSATKSDAGSGN